SPMYTYFPQRDGMFWQYAVTQNTNILPYSYKHLVVNLDHEVVDGLRLLKRRDHLGNLIYYHVDDAGIVRFGSRKNNQDIKLDPPGNYIIRLPLKSGTEWGITSRPYLM